LFASVMVLWLGVWMHDRRHAAAWQDYIKSSLVSGGGRFGFAILAFFSVYRELFEVILFYETLWLQAGPAGHNAVLAGGATALVLLMGWHGSSCAVRPSCRWRCSSGSTRRCCARCRWYSPGMV
jgi:high-affinity iron transporter